MGSFLSNLAKALLLITLLAHAGSVQAVPVQGSQSSGSPPPPAGDLKQAEPTGGSVPAEEAGTEEDEPLAESEPAGPPTPALPHPASPDPIYWVPTEGMEVVLTIDDGPSHLTEDFLAILAAEEVPAVFFWLAGSARLPLAAEVVRQGHQLGTHTISHPRLPRLPPAEAERQIAESKAALEAAAGVPIHFFRPPYGEHDRHTLETAAAHGLTTVLWNVDSRDWALADDPDTIIANVMARVKPGAVILIHERTQALAVLPALIRALREAGYTFVPLAEPVPAPASGASGE